MSSCSEEEEEPSIESCDPNSQKISSNKTEATAADSGGNRLLQNTNFDNHIRESGSEELSSAESEDRPPSVHDDDEVNEFKRKEVS
jgi:hypothetical protein